MNLISSDGVSRAHLNAVQSPQPWSHSLDIWQINSRIYNDIKFPAAFPSSLVTTKMRYFSECWRESSEIWASKKNFSLKSIISMIFTTPFKSCLSLTPTEFIYFFFHENLLPWTIKNISFSALLNIGFRLPDNVIHIHNFAPGFSKLIHKKKTTRVKNLPTCKGFLDHFKFIQLVAVLVGDCHEIFLSQVIWFF